LAKGNLHKSFLYNVGEIYFSLVGGFTVDVNFTQLSDNPSATFMSMFISSTPDSGFDKQVCTGKIKLIAINQPNCDGVVAGSTVDGEEIATIDKASKPIFLVCSIWLPVFSFNDLNRIECKN
jgi:hypothetical protein